MANGIMDITAKEREVLRAVRARSVMYIGEFSLSKLDCFLAGYKMALWSHDLDGQIYNLPDVSDTDGQCPLPQACCIIPDGFTEFVFQKYGLSGSRGYVWAILQQVPEGKEAIELFFRLLDEFLESNGFERI